jgi:hypothetical protein
MNFSNDSEMIKKPVNSLWLLGVDAPTGQGNKLLLDKKLEFLKIYYIILGNNLAYLSN